METITNAQFNKAGSPSEPSKRGKIVAAIFVLLIISIGVWATIVLVNAPTKYATQDIRLVRTFFLNTEEKNLTISVFEFNIASWEQFELNLRLETALHRDGDIQSFRADLPRQESSYCWWSFYWKSRFFVLATQEGSVAITNRFPRQSDLAKLDYVSPFPEEKKLDDAQFGWTLGNNNPRNLPMRNTLFGGDSRGKWTLRPGSLVSYLRAFNHDCGAYVSFFMQRPLRHEDKRLGHCSDPNCTSCRCDNPDCNRCRDAEP